MISAQCFYLNFVSEYFSIDNCCRFSNTLFGHVIRKAWFFSKYIILAKFSFLIVNHCTSVAHYCSTCRSLIVSFLLLLINMYKEMHYNEVF